MKTWIPYCFFLFPCILNSVVWALGVSYNNFFSGSIFDSFFFKPVSHCAILNRKESLLSTFKLSLTSQKQSSAYLFGVERNASKEDL